MAAKPAQARIYPPANQYPDTKGRPRISRRALICAKINTARIAVGTIMAIIMIAHMANIIKKSEAVQGLMPRVGMATPISDIPAILDMECAIIKRYHQQTATRIASAATNATISRRAKDAGLRKRGSTGLVTPRPGRSGHSDAHRTAHRTRQVPWLDPRRPTQFPHQFPRA